MYFVPDTMFGAFSAGDKQFSAGDKRVDNARSNFSHTHTHTATTVHVLAISKQNLCPDDC